MLKELYIENLAIIEKAVIPLTDSLNVFSGETGAGKSILIGGINAVLGGRVSKDIVRSGAERAVITALFDDIPDKTREKLAEYGYCDENNSENNEQSEQSELILTREISDTGNSVARVNGKTATASVLKEIAADLIDVHGQHQTRLITSPEVQLGLIDDFGKISLDGYQQVFREFSAVSKRIKAVQREMQLKDEKIELLSAKIADIEPYKLQKGEEESVAAELNRLRNIETVSQALNRAYACLSGTEDGSGEGAIELVNTCKTSLSESVRFIPECQPLKERLNSLFIELDDIKHEIAPLITENKGIEKLPKYEERMSDFLRLKRKYGLDPDELIDKVSQWQSELDALTGGDNLLQKLAEEKKSLGDKVKRLAEEITVKRKKTAERLSGLICKELDYLDMPGTRLIFEITQDRVTITGMDSVEMMIAVNKGEEPKPLAKIASGGELSRVMLAVKIVSAESDSLLNTGMVFDEIDTGISGRAAQKVGLKLSELSRGRQVLCVTHLAQIAALADNHLLIEKSDSDNRTYTSVRKVEGEERKRELARIISGDEDELSLANAERLIFGNAAKN